MNRSTASSVAATPVDTQPQSRPSRATSRRARRLRQPSRRNFWLHVLGGGGFIMAMQFGSPRLVLPWIGHHLSVAYILVALVLPLYQFGSVAAKLTIAPHITRVALRKRPVSSLGLLLAGLFVLMFAVAAGLTPGIAAIVLLGCAAMIGTSFGVLSVTHTDLQAKTVASRVRGKVSAHAATLGGMLTLAASFAIWALLPGPADHHLLLLWLAVGGWLGFAWAHSAIIEQPSEPVIEHGGLAQVRRGLALLGRYPWFARFVIWRILLLSVELAVPFYAIHAASLHAPTASNLSAFVVAMALGLVLSGPLWGRIIDRHNALVGVAACLLAAAAGVLVLIYDQLAAATPFWHAILFLPLSFAEEGVIQARNRYLSVRAPGAQRPLMLAVSSALLACASIVVAVIVGVAGHLHNIRTPLVILILFSLVAAAYTRRVFAD